MFGEDESESPRVPSPWDSFLPSPPDSTPSPQNSLALQNGIPKLVPEVEEVTTSLAVSAPVHSPFTG